MGELYLGVLQQGTVPDPSEPDAPLHFLESQMVNAGSRYFGFEIKFVDLRAMHLDMSSWLTRLDELGFTHFLVLQRRNALRALVSAQLAATGGPYHQRAGAPPTLRATTIEVTKTSPRGKQVLLVDRLRRREEWYSHLDQHLVGRNILRLTYEDDVERDPGVGYRRICAFLNVQPGEVPVRLGPTNPFPLTELIENVDEVAEALTGSPYAWMLDDIRP